MLERLFSYLFMDTNRLIMMEQPKQSKLMKTISLPLIFFYKVEVVPTNNDGLVHFSTMACPRNDATSN